MPSSLTQGNKQTAFQKSEQRQEERIQWFQNQTSLDSILRKRKENILNLQQERRAKAIEERRKLVDLIIEESQNNEDNPESETQSQISEKSNTEEEKKSDQIDVQNLFAQDSDDEMQIETNKFTTNQSQPNKKRRYKKSRRYFADQLQIHDFLLKQDLELVNDNNFMICVRPSGERCLVTSGRGQTIAHNQSGFSKAQFQSYLPNGSDNNETKNKIFGSNYSKRFCSALDCIYVPDQKTFYVLDILAWEDFVYQEFPLASRILFMQEKFANLPILQQEDQEYKFRLIEYLPCNIQNIVSSYYGQFLIKYVEDLFHTKGTHYLQLNTDQIFKDLLNAQSELFQTYSQIIGFLRKSFEFKIDETRIQSDINYAVSLFGIVHFNQDQSCYLKDGIVFSHLESQYEKGLNTLVIHWRDPLITKYCQEANENGMIDAILKLNNDYDFETMEGDVLHVSIFMPNKELIYKLNPGQIYNLKIKIGLDQIVKAADNCEKQLIITEMDLKKKALKLNADHLSKIISKFQQANGISVTIHDICNAIEQNAMETLYFAKVTSVGSMSLGFTDSNQSNLSSKMEL